VTDKYVIVPISAPLSLTEVRIYESTIAHASKHLAEFPTDMEQMVEAVRHGLMHPTHLEGSYGDSIVFIDAGTTNFSGDPLQVPVKPIAGTTSGRVRTFYFGSVSSTANIIWRRPD
jgi:hypothetical protein